MNAASSIFVVVPSFNEALVIRSTVEKLLRKGYRVVVVDDASTDGTRESLTGTNIHYLKHLTNLGQGAALQTGMEFAVNHGASHIVTFDADGQHDENDIEFMLSVLEEKKAGVVFGSRFLAGATSNMPQARKWVLKLARFINFLVSGILLTDANNGLRVMTREAAIRMQITENRSSHSAQIQHLVKHNNIPYVECPVNVSYSDYSKSKGVKNINSIRILYDLILYKLFH